MSPKRKPAPDQAERDAAIAERERNVFVDAGAGTGKTTILVDRLVKMVAPQDSNPAVPISRIAAITFTRKAAGELRLRIRERLLQELAVSDPKSDRDAQLRDAIAGLDTAHVGTIHGFADRLLRLRPVEADLSPSYEIAEGDDSLVHETFQVLIEAVQSGSLAAELEGFEAKARADEATLTLLDALDVGLRAESKELEFVTFFGIEALVAGFIRQRDLPPPDARPASFDKSAFQAAAQEFIRRAAGLRAESPGAKWISRMSRVLEEAIEQTDPRRIYSDVKNQLKRADKNWRKGEHFDKDNTAWELWNLHNGKSKQTALALKDQITAPLDRWMATRLVRIFPVVVALYEKVKARHGQLDQLDLLLKLRNLLRDNTVARGDYQRMFDHIFVDEFQDTDPLQAEIILFLCEKEPLAISWEDVVLADAKLTVVGDPKQSIYRFRRADVAMYDRVRQIVAKGKPLEAKLSANFRSLHSLIDWFNDRFERILKRSPDKRPFDPETGRVYQQPLAAGREGTAGRRVHVLPFDFGDGSKHLVDEYRQLEGRTLARYLRWLVEKSDVTILDPLDGRSRRIRYGDVAVLAISTWWLSLLFTRFDEEGIPYASRGGNMFLEDPLHRQFLLGLRAIADRDDGIAEAALLRPPFFSVDLEDLLREQAAPRNGSLPGDERVLRAREARELVRELRLRRFDRPPGATARDLLDRTAFGRSVALGPNGTQRLARLRELCLILEQTAADERLDYDAVTAEMRAWVDEPIQLDPPYPVGSEAVQVLTVHQAKGLEFPVVALWDGKCRWDTGAQNFAWRMRRDGSGWMLNLDGLTWEEPKPSAQGLKETEHSYLDQERRRVAYVAATRARDLLIVPKAGDVSDKKLVCSDLLTSAPVELIQIVAEYRDDHLPPWASQLEPPKPPSAVADGATAEAAVAAWWPPLAAEAARPRFRPVSVSGEAHATSRDDIEESAEVAPRKTREGRFGQIFGTTVHRAIGLMLHDPSLTPAKAVQLSAQRNAFADHLDEAIADVTRTLETLRAEGLVRLPGPDLQLEYPVAGFWGNGQLMTGYIDLVAATGNRLDILDFKTDAPPRDPTEQCHPDYAHQLRAYGALVGEAAATPGRILRCGLLFTSDGRVRWL